MRTTLFQKVIVVTILMVLLSFFLPIPQNQHVDSILVPATFLFGGIYSFEILKVIGNFSDLKKFLAVEASNLVYMYHGAASIGGNFSEAIQEKIERYILTSIDYSLASHISSTDQDFLSLIDPLETFESSNDHHRSSLKFVTHGFHNILQARYQLGQVAPKEISRGEWLMMIMLGSILLMTLLLSREVGFIPQFAAGVFSSTVIGTLLLLDEADANYLQETRLEYEIFNQVLEDIGRKPYFPEFALKQRIIQAPKNKTYRVGIFPKYPDLSVREVKEVAK